MTSIDAEVNIYPQSRLRFTVNSSPRVRYTRIRIVDEVARFQPVNTDYSNCYDRLSSIKSITDLVIKNRR